MAWARHTVNIYQRDAFVAQLVTDSRLASICLSSTNPGGPFNAQRATDGPGESRAFLINFMPSFWQEPQS